MLRNVEFKHTLRGDNLLATMHWRLVRVKYLCIGDFYLTAI
jgi:hypothetical protein